MCVLADMGGLLCAWKYAVYIVHSGDVEKCIIEMWDYMYVYLVVHETSVCVFVGFLESVPCRVLINCVYSGSVMVYRHVSSSYCMYMCNCRNDTFEHLE